MHLVAYVLILGHLVGAITSKIDRLDRSDNLRIATYNVRYDSKPDNITVRQTIKNLASGTPRPPSSFYGNLTEQPWSTRRIHIANDILWSGAYIFGGQELLSRQVSDMQELLGQQWSWIGIGRDPDNPQSNEFNPIFFRRLKLLSWDTFWLSLTPFEPSKFRNAGSFRLCTAARFKAPGSSFTLLNTHLDDSSSDQRALGASLVLHRAKYEAITTRRPVFLTGDFNSPPSDEAYKIITGSSQPVPINETFRRRFFWHVDDENEGFKNFTMNDLLAETPPERRSGSYATFTDWSGMEDFSSFQRLDYVFAGSSSGWSIKAYHVGQSLYDDGVYASDHRPVFADIEIDHDTSDSRFGYGIAKIMRLFQRYLV